MLWKFRSYAIFYGIYLFVHKKFGTYSCQNMATELDTCLLHNYFIFLFVFMRNVFIYVLSQITSIHPHIYYCYCNVFVVLPDDKYIHNYNILNLSPVVEWQLPWCSQTIISVPVSFLVDIRTFDVGGNTIFRLGVDKCHKFGIYTDPYAAYSMVVGFWILNLPCRLPPPSGAL